MRTAAVYVFIGAVVLSGAPAPALVLIALGVALWWWWR